MNYSIFYFKIVYFYSIYESKFRLIYKKYQTDFTKKEITFKNKIFKWLNRINNSNIVISKDYLNLNEMNYIGNQTMYLILPQ